MATDRFNGVVASKAIKVRCVVGAEANVASLNGEQIIEGISVSAGDRVLLTAQTDPIENGVWDVVSGGPWTRAADWDGNRDVEKGSTVWAGALGQDDKLWQVQTAGTILPGTTAVTITELFNPAAPSSASLADVTSIGDDTLGNDITISSADPTLTLQDNNNAGSGAAGNLIFVDSAAAEQASTRLSSLDLVLDSVNGNILMNSANGYIRAVDTLIAGDPGTEGGGILVGGASYTSALKVSDIGDTHLAEMILHRHSSSLPATIVTSRSASTDDSHGLTDNNSFLFLLTATGWDGATYQRAAEIGVSVDGVSGAGDMPGRLVFSTTPDGGFSPLERLRIDSAGITTVTGELRVRTTGATATPPAGTGHGIGRIEMWDADSTDRLLGIGYETSPHLGIRNYIYDGQFILSATNISGVERRFLEHDPGGDTFLNSAQSVFLRASNTSIIYGGSVSNSGAYSGGTQVTRTTSRAAGGWLLYNDKTHPSAGTFSRALSEPDIEAGQFLLFYGFTTNISATDPGATNFKFNNASMSLATEMYINDSSNNSMDAARVLDNLVTGDVLRIANTQDESEWIVLQIGVPVDNTGWWTIPVTVLASNGTNFSSDDCVIDVQWNSTASSVPDGTADYQVLIWDETTDQAWEPSTQLTIREDNIGGGNIYFVGGATDFLRWSDTDGGVVHILEPILRLEDSRRIDLWPTGGASRPFMRGLSGTDYIEVTAENQSAWEPYGMLVRAPLAVQAMKPAPNTLGDTNKLWAFQYNVNGSTPMMCMNEDGISYPVGAPSDQSYTFNTPTTAADPGTNFMRMNTADFATGTEFYFDDINNMNEDAVDWFSELNVNDILLMYCGSDRNRWCHAQVDSITDNTGWYTLGVTILAHSGTNFINADDVRIQVVRQSLGGTIAGSITNDQIAFGAATANEIEGDADLTWSATNERLTIGSLGWQIGETPAGLGFGFHDPSNNPVLYYDAGTMIYDDTASGGVNSFRIASGNTFNIHGPSGARAELSVDSANFLLFDFDSTTPVGVKLNYPLYLDNDPVATAPYTSGYSHIWAAGNTTFSGVLVGSGADDMSHPISNLMDRVYTFVSTTTATDPGTANWKANTNDLSTITSFYVDDLDYTEDDIDWWWSMLAVGDVLHVHSPYNAPNVSSGLYEITSLTDNTGWWTIGVTDLWTSQTGAATVWTNGQPIQVSVQKASLAGTVTSVSAGNGMDFTTITGAGPVTMGTPGTIGVGTGNAVTATSHTHALDNDIVNVQSGGAADRIAYFIDSNSVEGSASFTWDGSELNVGGTLVDVDNSAAATATTLRARDSSGGISMAVNGSGAGQINQISSAGAAEDTWIAMARNGGVQLNYNNVAQVATTSLGTQFDLPLYLFQRAAANTDSGTFGQIWVNSADDHLYFTNDTGTDYQISGASGSTTLAGLTDTNITSPANGHLLMWDSTPGEWVDATTLPFAYTFSNRVLFTGSVTGQSMSVSDDINLVDGAAVSLGTGSGGTGDIKILFDGTEIDITALSAQRRWNWFDGPEIRWWDSTDTDWIQFRVTTTNLDITESGLDRVNWPAAGTLDLSMNDNTIDQPILQDYAIEYDTEDVTGTTVTFTYSLGPVFECDMEAATGNVTATLSGGPPTGTHGQITVLVQQDTTVRTLSWAGGTFRWAGGTAHPVTTTANGFSIFTFETWDGGTTWYGAGADYS